MNYSVPPSLLCSTAGGGLVSLLALTCSSCTTQALGTITPSGTVCVCVCVCVLYGGCVLLQSGQCEAEH